MAQLRDAAVSAAVPAPIDLLSRSLSRDSGAQFHLTTFLSLAELGRLHGVSRTWLGWLEHPTGGWMFPRRRIAFAPSPVPGANFATLAECAWARGFVSSLVLKVVTPSIDTVRPPGDYSAFQGAEPDPLPCPPSSSASTQHWTRVLGLLSLFPRLNKLVLEYEDGSRIDAEALRACMAALAGTLTKLELVLTHIKDSPETTLALLRAGIPTLQKLQELRIHSTGGQYSRTWVTQFDFELFTTLPRLHTLHRNSSAHELLSAAQASALARCPALTNLGWGRWDRVVALSDSLADTLDARREHAERGLGAFVSARLAQGSKVAPLRELDLSTTILCTSLWNHVSRLKSLTTLMPRSWHADLSVADWEALPSLGALTKLKIMPCFSRDLRGFPFGSEKVWPALVKCTNLSDLDLRCLRISSAQLRELIQSAPALAALRLFRVELADVAPFALAQNLTYLRMTSCTPPRASSHASSSSSSSQSAEAKAEAAAPFWHSLLPRIPKLQGMQVMVQGSGSEVQDVLIEATIRATNPTITNLKLSVVAAAMVDSYRL